MFVFVFRFLCFFGVAWWYAVLALIDTMTVSCRSSDVWSLLFPVVGSRDYGSKVWPECIHAWYDTRLRSIAEGGDGYVGAYIVLDWLYEQTRTPTIGDGSVTTDKVFIFHNSTVLIVSYL